MRKVSNDALEQEEEQRSKKTSKWLGRGRSPPAGGVKSPISLGSIDRLLSAPKISSPEISPGKGWEERRLSHGSEGQEKRLSPG